MSLREFLYPVDPSLVDSIRQNAGPGSLADQIQISIDPDDIPDDTRLAIIGVFDDRFNTADSYSSDMFGEPIRRELYTLSAQRSTLKIIDLGDIQNGKTPNDTRLALRAVIDHLLASGICTLIIGNSMRFAYPQFTAAQSHARNMNVLLVDARADLMAKEIDTDDPYLNHIILRDAGNLFNVTVAGYQSYYVSPNTYDTFERMNFDLVRYGSLRGQIQEIEPYCRAAHQFSFNLNAVRAADAPAQEFPSPNGFSGEDACQIARYAGMSGDTMSAGFYGYISSLDTTHCSARLIAQMIWYFIDGFSLRKPDYPSDESNDYIKYTSTFRNSNHVVIFYKSLLSNRWWMEVPYPNEKSGSEGKFLVPCSYSDYQMAQNDEIPDRWLKTLQKLI